MKKAEIASTASVPVAGLSRRTWGLIKIANFADTREVAHKGFASLRKLFIISRLRARVCERQNK